MLLVSAFEKDRINQHTKEVAYSTNGEDGRPNRHKRAHVLLEGREEASCLHELPLARPSVPHLLLRHEARVEVIGQQQERVWKGLDEP